MLREVADDFLVFGPGACEGRGRIRACLLPAVVLAAGVLAGCSSEDPPSGQVNTPQRPASTPSSGSPISTPPDVPRSSTYENLPAVVMSARIVPNPIVLDRPVRVVIEARDPENQAVSFRRQWIVDGKPLQGQTGPTLEPELLKRGDMVSVEVTAADPGGRGTPYLAEEVRVGNTPPEVTAIRFEPFPPRVGDRVVAHIQGRDYDFDDITYALRWLRNEEVVLEDEDTLDTSAFRRGDTIILEVVPSDPTHQGEVQQSETLTVANSPPVITSRPSRRLGAGRYDYQVVATDRDGDDLLYALEAAPAGMTIDSKTGRIEWRFGSEAGGRHRVRVTVSDGHEEDAGWQEFDIVLNGRTGEG